MSEIEKMYENAGIKKEKKQQCVKSYKTENGIGICIDFNKRDDYIYYYPPFTAEKQLSIFKMFCTRYLEVSQHVEENGDLCFGIKSTVGDYAVGFNKDFAECLADFVNCLWQDLTEEEKQQVKEILE